MQYKFVFVWLTCQCIPREVLSGCCFIDEVHLYLWFAFCFSSWTDMQQFDKNIFTEGANVFISTWRNIFIASLFPHFLCPYVTFAPTFDPWASAAFCLHSVSLAQMYFSFPLSPPLSLPLSLQQPSMQWWDIAFLILLTGDNIYVLFSNIHFSCAHTVGLVWPRHKSTAQTHALLFSPLLTDACICLMCSLHFPLCLFGQHIYKIYVFFLVG